MLCKVGGVIRPQSPDGSDRCSSRRRFGAYSAPYRRNRAAVASIRRLVLRASRAAGAAEASVVAGHPQSTNRPPNHATVRRLVSLATPQPTPYPRAAPSAPRAAPVHRGRHHCTAGGAECTAGGAESPGGPTPATLCGRRRARPCRDRTARLARRSQGAGASVPGHERLTKEIERSTLDPTLTLRDANSNMA